MKPIYVICGFKDYKVKEKALKLFMYQQKLAYLLWKQVEQMENNKQMK